MRAESPSITALGVAVARAALERPAAPAGDPDIDRRLAALLGGEPRNASFTNPTERADFFGYLAVRTRFIDDAVMRALDEGVTQIVILGAGYDTRAVRFRTPGARFFEVDHPATQRDKRARLAELRVPTDDIVFVAADFTQHGLADRLVAAGYDANERTLFTCEGVLRYLPEEWFRELLRATAAIASPESELVATISTREDDDALPDRERARQTALAEAGEPVLTVPPRAAALEWVTAAGWSVDHVEDVNASEPHTRRGRLRVHAMR